MLIELGGMIYCNILNSNSFMNKIYKKSILGLNYVLCSKHLPNASTKTCQLSMAEN